MVLDDRFAKTARLIQIYLRLAGKPGGYTTHELAEQLSRSQRTIQRDIVDLTLLFPDVLQEGSHFLLDRSKQLAPMRFTIEEGRALYVALRAAARFADRADPALGTAASRIARALPADVGGAIERSLDLLFQQRREDHHYVQVLDTVTTAWVNRRVLRLQYQSPHAPLPKEVIYEPYWIEPLPQYQLYLVGQSRTHRAIRTLKVDRIVQAELTPETFRVPPDFDVHALLRSAWGIMYAEGQSYHVVLRFSPRVAYRVHESLWHPSQRLTDQQDGGVILEIDVSNTTELGPWVRSWGPDVEVLAPDEFRAEIAADLARALTRYDAAPVS